MRLLARILAASALACSTACSSVATQTGVPGTLATSAPADHGATGSLAIRIVVPARNSMAARARRPAYVSSATASIAGQIVPVSGGAPTTFAQGLTPTSPGCVGSATSSLTCTLIVALAPGGYTVSIGTFDGPIVGGMPTGNALSGDQNVPETVAAGVANILPITLDGIPTKIAFVPAAASSFSGTVAAGYSLSLCDGYSPGIDTASVVGVDADNNYIVGVGAPVVTLVSSAPGTLSVGTPAANSPNLYPLGQGASAVTGSAVTLTATAQTPAATASGGIAPADTVTTPISITFAACGVVTTASDTAPGTPLGAGPGNGNATATGPMGDLRYVLQNTPAGGEIIFQVPGCSSTSGAAACHVYTAAPLPPIEGSVTVDGADLITVDGIAAAGSTAMHRVFFVDAGSVVLRNLTIANGQATGGAGSSGYATTAGGGCGAGAGVFVNRSTAIVTLANVTFTNLGVVGGNGGTFKNGISPDEGGGGGFGFAGGPFSGGGVLATSLGIDGGYGGGGGYGGADANGSVNGDGGAPYGSNAGGQPGAGTTIGGAGGFGGGGGSGATVGGAGGFGGGGGAARNGQGGAGGYCGGGAGTEVGTTMAPGGPYGGNGAVAADTVNIYASGGGGGALGPAVFVYQGSLTVTGGTATGLSAVAGRGGMVTPTGAQRTTAAIGSSGTADATPVFDADGSVNGVQAVYPGGPVTGVL